MKHAFCVVVTALLILPIAQPAWSCEDDDDAHCRFYILQERLARIEANLARHLCSVSTAQGDLLKEAECIAMEIRSKQSLNVYELAAKVCEGRENRLSLDE